MVINKKLYALAFVLVFVFSYVRAEPYNTKSYEVNSTRLDIEIEVSSKEVEFDNEFKDYLNEYFLINED